ncbi:MAG: molybdenum cofactor guanylyltransferase [Bacteroidota bacterium]
MRDLIGLVLLGGRSRRMGKDKAWISYHQQPQWLHCINLLQAAGIQKAFLSGQVDQKALYPEDILWLSDPHLDEGPMGGILHALMENHDQAVLSIPVDMPAVKPHTIQRLIGARVPEKAATVFRLPKPGYIHPLLAIWEPHILPDMKRAWQQGQRSPRRFLQSQSIHIVSGLPDAEAKNVNRPDDWPT